MESTWEVILSQENRYRRRPWPRGASVAVCDVVVLIGLELMVRGRLRVREVPIAFVDRHRGKSKLRWRQQVDYLRHLGRLYAHVLVRALRRSAPRR